MAVATAAAVPGVAKLPRPTNDFSPAMRSWVPLSIIYVRVLDISSPTRTLESQLLLRKIDNSSIPMHPIPSILDLLLAVLLSEGCGADARVGTRLALI